MQENPTRQAFQTQIVNATTGASGDRGSREPAPNHLQARGRSSGLPQMREQAAASVCHKSTGRARYEPGLSVYAEHPELAAFLAQENLSELTPSLVACRASRSDLIEGANVHGAPWGCSEGAGGARIHLFVFLLSELHTGEVW